MRAYDVVAGMLSKDPDTVLRMSKAILKMATRTYKERERLLFKAYDLRSEIKINEKKLKDTYSPRNAALVRKAVWLIEHSKEKDCPCYIVFETQNQNGEKLRDKYNFDFEKVKTGVKVGFDKFKNTLKNGKEELKTATTTSKD